MTYKMEITGLSHDDLVSILSTSLYSNPQLSAEYDRDKYQHLFNDDDCYEDKMAKILLDGGQITIIDMESYDDIESEMDYHTYGVPNVNWRSTELVSFTNNWSGEDFQCVGYNIDLQTLLLGINKNEKAKELAKELLVDEDGDLYTAYNLIQCAVLGDEIYG